MKRFLIGFFVGLACVTQSVAFTAGSDTTELKPKPVYGKEAKVVAYILDNNHYRKIQLNDSLSSVILDEYVKNL